MSLSDVMALSDNERQGEQLEERLQGIVSHIAACDRWDDGEATTYTTLQSYGYKCGCGWEVHFPTGLVVWAEYYVALLPPGFTEKMRFLSIRGAYWASIAAGTHRVVRQLKLGPFNFGELLKPIPRRGGRYIFGVDAFKGIPVKFQGAKHLSVTLPTIQGVVLTNRGDDDPLNTHVTVNCTIEDCDAQEQSERQETQGSAGTEGVGQSQDGLGDVVGFIAEDSDTSNGPVSPTEST